MEYFVSHIGIIFLGAAFVALCAVAWWYLTDKNARLIRERKAAKRREAEAAPVQGGNSPDDKR